MTRRDLAAEEARSRILQAAANCIVRDGIAKVRMAGIAKTAGVSSGLVHYHFDTKEQLFAELLSWSSEVSAVLTRDATGRSGGSAAVRLSTFLDRCLPSNEKLTHDWQLWQELDLLCMREPELTKVSADVYESFYSAVAEIISDGRAEGIFDVPAKEVREVAEAAVAMCDGLGSRVLSAEPDLTLAQARTMVARSVARMVGHDGALPRLGARR